MSKSAARAAVMVAMVLVAPAAGLAGDEGLITRWLVAGPFAHENPYALLDEHPAGDPKTLAPSPGDAAGDAKWIEVAADNGVVDLKKAGIQAPAKCAAAAMVYVYVPKMTPAKMLMGFAEGMVAFVNGQEVYRYPREKRLGRDRYRADVLLGAGWNRLYMQVPRHENPRRQWGLVVRLVNQDLEAIEGLKLATANPVKTGKPPEPTYRPFVSAYAVEHFGTHRVRVVNRTPLELPEAKLRVVSRGGKTLMTADLGTIKGNAHVEAEVEVDEVTYQREYPHATAEVAFRGGKLSAPLAKLVIVGQTHRVEYETPHVNRMRPWAGERPVVLIVSPRNSRQPIELVQRGDLEWHLVNLDDPNAAGRLGEELKLYTFDCIVLASQRWKRLPHAEEVLAAVKAGAGLVVVTPLELPAAVDELLGLEGSAALMAQRTRPGRVEPGAGWKSPAAGGPKAESEGAEAARLSHPILVGEHLPGLPPVAPAPLKTAKDATVVAKVGDAPVVIAREGKTGAATHRTVVLNFGRGSSLIWPISRDLILDEYRLPVWERQWSLLLKSILWAGKKDGGAKVFCETAGTWARQGRPPGVGVDVFGSQDASLRAEPMVRARGYDARSLGAVSFSKVSAGLAGGRRLPADMPAGENEIDVVLRDKDGQVLWWANTVVQVAPRGSIKEIALAPEKVYYRPGDDLSFTVTGKADAEGLSLRAALADNKGRVVAELPPRAVKKGEFSETFKLAPAGLLTTVARFTAALAAEKHEEARAEKVFFVRHEFMWDNYEPVIWLTRGGVRWHYDVEYFRMLREAMGVNNGWSANFGNRSTAYNQMVHGGLDSVGQESLHFFSMNHNWTKATFEMRRHNFHKSKHDVRWLYRTPIDRKTKMPVDEPDYENLRFGNNPHNSYFPLDDPKYHEWTKRKIAHQLKDHVRYNPLGYDLMDEGSYTSYARAFDFDWSPVSLKHFRIWLKGEYGTLEALNKEWETEFASWDDVKPMHIHQVRARNKGKARPNYAPWVDHRRYGDIVYNRYIKLCSDAARAVDPDAYVGIGGGQHANPYGGWDYWLVTNHFTWIENYFLITTEYIRSFNTPDRRLKACPGCDVWFSVMHGNVGFYRWVDTGHCRNDFSLLRRGEVTATQHEEVRGRGFAKLFFRADAVDDPIAIHYSQSAILLAHAAGELVRANQYGYGGPLDAKKGFYHLLEEMGRQFKFVAYAQLEDGELEKKGYRLMILPESTALSDAEADRLKRFVSGGGVVLCDRGAGGWNHHGRKRPENVLKTHFDMDPAAAGEKQIGKGWVVNLNSDFPRQYWRDRNSKPVATYWKTLDGVLAKAGLAEPRARMVADGKPARRTEVRYFKLGRIAYHVVRAELPGRYEFRAADEGHLYDMRERRYGGRGKRIEVEASGELPALVAASPYKIEAVEVCSPKNQVRPGQDVSIPAAVKASAAPGVHALRFRVYGPDGRERPYYGDTLFGDGGRATLTIPTALNEAKGRWTVKVSDLASGVTGEGGFSIQ